MAFVRPQHNVIAELLRSMDASFLEGNKCYFGGGAAIVLQNGEYRLSKDVDFMCADQGGYRELRMLATEKGAKAFFSTDVETVRELQADGYGIRGVVKLNGLPIKFEIVKEGNLRELSGAVDPALGIPVLSLEDQFAEKLLANADRCLDKVVARRDAIDLGYLVQAKGGFIPPKAIEKAEDAYGRVVTKGVATVLGLLSTKPEIIHSAQALDMKPEDVFAAASRLHAAAIQAWPELDFIEFPKDEIDLPEPK